MKSIVLVPYCPLPIDTGGKVEMWKHLNVLKDLGPCTIVSARRRPVGLGWTPKFEKEVRSLGFELLFRDDSSSLNWKQVLGYFYGLFCKGLGLEKAFGHSNPYHRYAFPEDWWREQTRLADLAVINYSYWAWLPCDCPKVIALLDLWSDFMWEGATRETQDLKAADLVVVISKDEELKLNRRHVTKTLWSPPAVGKMDFPISEQVGLIGSPSPVNREGLRWLSAAVGKAAVPIRVYGGLADMNEASNLRRIGSYENMSDPYRECGIILMTTALGMGVQIKAIEALAAGRAIIARKGAMRGLPPGEGAWIEVEQPQDMIREMHRLVTDQDAFRVQARRSREYYQKWLNAERLKDELMTTYQEIAVTNKND